MGYVGEMLKFIKSLLKKEKEEPVIEEFSLESLKEHLEKSPEGDIVSKAKAHIKKYDDAAEELRKTIDEMRQAELRNKKIPTRALQVAMGNRETYAEKTEQFSHVRIEGDTVDEIKASCERFNQQLNILNKTTKRSFFVLQEFFAHESGEVAKAIKGMDTHVRSIQKEIRAARVEERRKILNMIQDINAKTAAIEDMKKDKEKKEIELKRINKDISAASSDLSDLKKSDEWKKREELVMKKKDLQRSLKREETEAYHHFSTIEKALKKYQRMSLDKDLVGKYIKEPIATLAKDENLKISEIIAKMKESIDKLDLKDKKKQKTLESLETLDDKFLNDFRKRYLRIQGDIEEIHKEISDNNATEQKAEIDNKIASLENEKHLLEKKLAGIQDSLSSFSLKSMKEEIEEELKYGLRMEAKIR